jgi:alginate O-acetyltransferase complex protein AlgI
MFFASYQFILVFLPLVYVGYWLAHRFGGWEWAIRFLGIASLGFFASFGLSLLAILFVSICFNFFAASLITAKAEERDVSRRLMVLAIIANVAVLGYLKYTNFLIDIANTGGLGMSHMQLGSSIGVSFFTFIQIGYLIDAYNGQLLRHEFFRYVMFSAFFPCVTAGPLVLQKELMPQLDKPYAPIFNLRRFTVGATMFAIGVFKKAALADSIAPYADSVFTAAATGSALDPATAWVGTLCYTLQLYFDFSGYSDMALGLGAIFGFRLPLNFNSPFKTTNISDFWRNWHMTMTRFFTSYIYTGLAMKGMRKSMQNRSSRLAKLLATAAFPSVVTFLVAGVWHGAGWNFVVYGLLHGVAIATYLMWREYSTVRLPPVVAWFCMMAVVVTGLAIFRSPDLGVAARILGEMWDLPSLVAGITSPLAGFDFARALAGVVLLGSATLLLPNTQQILHLDWVSSDSKPASTAALAGLLAWRPRFSTACVTAFTLTIALASIGSGTNFLYYQF